MFIFIVASCFALHAGAQSDSARFRNVLHQVNATYKSSMPLNSQVEYNFYQNGLKKEADESLPYTCISSPYSQYVKSGEIESVSDTAFNVFIDHGRKLVSVEKRRETLNTLPFNLDTLYQYFEKISMTKAGETEIWSVSLSSKDCDRFELTLNSKTHLIKTIRFYLKPVSDEMGRETLPVLEIRIKSQVSTGKNTTELHSLNFVSVDQMGKVSLKGKIKQYQLLTPIIE